MFKDQLSQTVLSNINILAGLLVMVLPKLGMTADQSQVSFVIGALWILGWNAYSYWDRLQKGDISLSGFKKNC